MDEASTEASTGEFARSDSSRDKAPEIFEKLAFHIGDHHVLDLELRGRVSWVDVPGSG